MYTVKEVEHPDRPGSLENYVKVESGLTITNRYVSPKIDIDATKVWVDGDPNARPTISFQLYRDGEAMPVAEAPIKELSHGLTMVSWNVDKTDGNGRDYVYTVREKAPPVGYTVSGEGTAANGYTITNTYVVPQTKVSVSKVWRDASNQDGKRPAGVTVNLMDGTTVVATQVLNAANEWKYTWDPLPATTKAAVPITYTVTEDEVADYDDPVIVPVEGGFRITNARTPEIVNIPVRKVWSDADDQDGVRPASIWVNLWNGTTLMDRVSLSEANGWQYSFADKPVYQPGQVGMKIVYTVTEDTVGRGYTPTCAPEGVGFIVDNARTPELIDIPVTKTWDDGNDQDGVRPAEIIVRLLADEVEIDSGKMLASDGWATIRFEDLPKYRDGGTEIVYTIEEDEVGDGYAATINGFDIVNTRTPERVDVPVVKAWDDASDQDGMRPASVELVLMGDGTEAARCTLTGTGDSWNHTFASLPKYAAGQMIAYSVVEEGDPGEYVPVTTLAAPRTITNRRTPDITSRTVIKVWEDDADRDRLRPESVVVQLMADGEAYGEPVTVSGPAWTHTWEDLPLRAAGQLVEYTVVEVGEVTGYVATVDGFTITNTHAIETTSLTGVKIWDDADDQDGRRPEAVKLQLRAGATAVGEPVEVTGPNWAYTWDELPVYDAGERIDYNIVELEVADGYTKSEAGMVVTNSYDPETVVRTAKKIWEDGNDKDGLRPSTILVQLVADGKNAGDAVVLTEANGWTYNWVDLPKYAEGVEIAYTVREVAVPAEYAVSYDGMTIVNMHVLKPRTVVVPPKASPKTGDLLIVPVLLAAAFAVGGTGAMLNRPRRREDDDR